MASTAEELSSQALQLQETISYFRLDAMAMRHRAAPPKALAAARPAHKPAAPKAAAPRKPAKGVSLDLGAEASDDDFERF
jgi:methyl-accepting chemotaxis protein